MDYFLNPINNGSKSYSLDIPTASYSFNFGTAGYSMDFETHAQDYGNLASGYSPNHNPGALNPESPITPSKVEIISPQGRIEQPIENLIDRFLKKETEQNEIDKAMERQRD